MTAQRLSVTGLLRPHWPLLAVAGGAMLVQGFTELLEPWPLKIIFDYVLGSKPVPPWLEPWIGNERLGVLDVAALSVVLIAIVNAVSAFADKYLTSTVGKR